MIHEERRGLHFALGSEQILQSRPNKIVDYHEGTELGPDIYIPPLTRKREQQQFTIRSGLLTGISFRHRSAISDHPLPDGFWTSSLQL